MRLKKILISLFLCFICLFGVGIKCFGASVDNLQSSPNYKGMSIIPKGKTCDNVLVALTINCSSNSNTAISMTMNLSEDSEMIMLAFMPKLYNKNSVQNVYSFYNDFLYLGYKNKTYSNIEYGSVEMGTLGGLYQYVVDFKDISRTDFFFTLPSRYILNNTSLNNLYTDKYCFTILFYFKSFSTTDYLYFYNDSANIFNEYTLSINYIYNYDSIYSYYNVNSLSIPYDFYANYYDFDNINLTSVSCLMSSNSFLDLKPCFPTLRASTNEFYGMWQFNYMYAYLMPESYTNKSFSDVSNGLVDLYVFNGSSNKLQDYSTGVYVVDNDNTAISSDYFDINFKYFAYQVNYNGYFSGLNFAETPDFNPFNVYLNNECFFKNNSGYYYNDVGSTDNTDLTNDLGISYITCDWWNLKGQLNNLFYYLITGLPFLNKFYTISKNAFGIVKVGFNFFTWSIPLTTFIGFIISIKILFNRFLE